MDVMRFDADKERRLLTPPLAVCVTLRHLPDEGNTGHDPFDTVLREQLPQTVCVVPFRDRLNDKIDLCHMNLATWFP